MDGHKYTPDTISVEQFIQFLKINAEPIEGLNIPNVVIPSHLSNKKRITEADDNIILNIRHLFNSLSNENLDKIRELLKQTIMTKTRDEQMLNDVAKEILSNFLISDKNIENFMHLLNAVSNACLECGDKSNGTNTRTPPIAKYFIDECKFKIFEFINEQYVKQLAEMNMDDDDELDSYNKKRDSTVNLIITLCHLYDQRNDPKKIKITANNLYPLIEKILNIYISIQSKMKKLGNPYEGEDCEDENEFEILSKMSTLYAEQLYTFMSKRGRQFLKDETVIKGNTMKLLVNKFRNDIVPTISEAYLIAKCEFIKYD
ncbi:hypothetical protein QJ854_gp313 [Moumouvirus goulette]|uniref:Uncharacterized protein n=1 Tax=Moumouvirus goulette TaxID=1247379 RepID=M1PC11_9VIRU|nr:hypothetical protein QJ854_gp313 [Moumouvirus goulette]AGF85469.1 hypothetical protein glt_00661 [Moumouvirus goulette]